MNFDYSSRCNDEMIAEDFKYFLCNFVFLDPTHKKKLHFLIEEKENCLTFHFEKYGDYKVALKRIEETFCTYYLPSYNYSYRVEKDQDRTFFAKIFIISTYEGEYKKKILNDVRAGNIDFPYHTTIDSFKFFFKRWHRYFLDPSMFDKNYVFKQKYLDKFWHPYDSNPVIRTIILGFERQIDLKLKIVDKYQVAIKVDNLSDLFELKRIYLENLKSHCFVVFESFIDVVINEKNMTISFKKKKKGSFSYNTLERKINAKNSLDNYYHNKICFKYIEKLANKKRKCNYNKSCHSKHKKRSYSKIKYTEL